MLLPAGSSQKLLTSNLKRGSVKKMGSLVGFLRGEVGVGAFEGRAA